MAKAVQTVAWDQTSILWATLANANRDEKKQRTPFSPSDIHPFRSHADFADRADGKPDWVAIAQIRKQFKHTVLHGDQSGRSVS